MDDLHLQVREADVVVGDGRGIDDRPEDIVLGQVVRQTEEDLAIAECFGGGCCLIAGRCELQRALAEVLQAFLLVLDRYTLADLVRPRGAALAGRLGLSPHEGARP